MIGHAPVEVLPSMRPLPRPAVRNLARLIFEPLPWRSESGTVLLSHDDTRLVRVSLSSYRRIVLRLWGRFEQKGLGPGDTVLLASVPGNNEMYVSLLFSALASFGIRVLMPMFMESGELDAWLEASACRAVICPGLEILGLEHHDREKRLVREIQSRARERGLPLYDALGDFQVRDLAGQSGNGRVDDAAGMIEAVADRTDASTESLIITTSGSSGAARLVVYEQGAFLNSCASWQAAGFFAADRFGGRGFTPLFTHTMGVRAFMNAVWSGHPICLITTDWFLEKPEMVRHFLMGMKPQHITGGPATFRLLLDMMRRYPELKTEMAPHLRTLVSSGAPMDTELAAELETVFGVSLHNAFGTTETQQVCSTLLNPDPDPRHRDALGTPLPGVSLRLEPLNGSDLFRLSVRTPFGCKGVLGAAAEPANGAFRLTGDIVRRTAGRTYFAGREAVDHFKDGFGVKVPVVRVRDWYSREIRACEHLEVYPLSHEPGLAALLFISDPVASSGLVTDAGIRERFARMFEGTNEQLYEQLDPFAYRHHTIARFALINDPVPRTPKGSVATPRIGAQYAQTIGEMVSVFPARAAVWLLEDRERGSSPYARHVNPYVAGVLDSLKMDRSYHRSRKDSLYYSRAGVEHEVLDMAGGFGVNLLGHNHPDLRSCVREFLDEERPGIADQVSIQAAAGLLGRRLSHLLGARTGKHYCVAFGSSGAEAVEMALHHASLEWREDLEKAMDRQFRLLGGTAGPALLECREHNASILASCRLHVVVSGDAFHGHTSGARSLLKECEERRRFSNLLPLTPIPVDDRDPDWLASFQAEADSATVDLQEVVVENGRIRRATRKASTIIAALFEPVIGEGGIRAVDARVLRHFSGQRFPLILDEIQCGLGRTGSIPSVPGVDADYLLLAKALGGGIERVSALLVESTRFIPRFGRHYASTFGNGGLAAHVALKVIDIIERDDVPRRAQMRGERLRADLSAVQQRYPDVIAAVTGSGLMQGIRFVAPGSSAGIVARVLEQRRVLGWVLSSWLLNRRGIRVLPSLSAPDVLRVEPSAYLTDAEIDRFTAAIEDLARMLHERRLYDLFRHLMDGDDFTDTHPPAAGGLLCSEMEDPADGATRVAFIAHFTHPVEELRAFDRGFGRASDTGLRILFRRLQVLLEGEPVTLFRKNLLGGRISFQFLVLPLDSAEMERRHREGHRRSVVRKIQTAVDQAVADGARIVSLGAYTSILTDNGMAISAPEGVRVITGNTLTAATGIRSVVDALRSSRAFRKKNVLAIVGAPGNIGTILARKLVPMDDLFGEVILVGRGRRRLDRMLEALRAEIVVPPGLTITPETDLRCLDRCDVIVISTNTNDPIVFPHHLKRDDPILIVDHSVPSAVAAEVGCMSNVTTLPFASFVRLPEDPDLVISPRIPAGTAFCCAAEAILCGLEDMDVPLKGRITVEALDRVDELAARHGFFGVGVDPGRLHRQASG